MQTDILSLTYEELAEKLGALGQPKYRAKQVFAWLHSKQVLDFAQMTNLSIQFREQLGKNFYINEIKIRKKLVSQLDDTVKYLYELRDGEFVETVVMRYHHGNSICVSTQVGCRMGCSFCASTKAGFVRHLTPSEILGQIYTAERDLGEKISNVVLMGIGEPLDNFDNVLTFLELLSHPEGRNLGMRHVTLSTCGLVDQIYRLAEKNLQITLSISLHAPNDGLRSQTMPVNRRYPIDELLAACRAYADRTGRRISFEYALIDGFNDSPAHAKELASRIRGMLCHVNLIPVNRIEERDYASSSQQNVKRFVQVLESSGINATVRRTLGQDINAACGQLRRDEKDRGGCVL